MKHKYQCNKSNINNSKDLNDHMIVNSLDFPSYHRMNINPNIADEELFSAKDSECLQANGQIQTVKYGHGSEQSKYVL